MNGKSNTPCLTVLKLSDFLLHSVDFAWCVCELYFKRYYLYHEPIVMFKMSCNLVDICCAVTF